ncbi:MAG: winged helix-turn-helix domain-containing protein [Chloroflexi bacterium]|nr:winged helix-turn-helix domain-containing protein [Chloroflexota bacterium]
MSLWDDYPRDYRQREVKMILNAARAGESVSLIGLSGAGKSNLMGYIAHTQGMPTHPLVLVDFNRLTQRAPSAFFNLIRQALADSADAPDEINVLQAAIQKRLNDAERLTLLLDLSLLLNRGVMFGEPDLLLFNNLRALRDAFKFQLTFITATRHPLPSNNEFAELFHANTIYLGALSESDAMWNVKRYAERAISRVYPSFLRAACEAYSSGASLEAIPNHPAMQSRLDEFWSDDPAEDELRLSHLTNHPLLKRIKRHTFDTTNLTAKENLLLDYFIAHADQVCEKDDLIRAVWAEDKAFERGVRDDSLAQLVRRLREKIEPDPSNPKHVHTVAGRGYKFTQ